MSPRLILHQPRTTSFLVEKSLERDESGSIAVVIHIMRSHAHNIEQIGAHRAAHVLKQWAESFL